MPATSVGYKKKEKISELGVGVKFSSCLKQKCLYYESIFVSKTRLIRCSKEEDQM